MKSKAILQTDSTAFCMSLQREDNIRSQRSRRGGTQKIGGGLTVQYLFIYFIIKSNFSRSLSSMRSVQYFTTCRMSSSIGSNKTEEVIKYSQQLKNCTGRPYGARSGSSLCTCYGGDPFPKECFNVRQVVGSGQHWSGARDEFGQGLRDFWF